MGFSKRKPVEGQQLAAREHETLRYVCKGYKNTEIGGLMGIAKTTVDCHLRAILVKLGVCTRSEAAYQAGRRDLLGDGVTRRRRPPKPPPARKHSAKPRDPAATPASQRKALAVALGPRSVFDQGGAP